MQYPLLHVVHFLSSGFAHSIKITNISAPDIVRLKQENSPIADKPRDAFVQTTFAYEMVMHSISVQTQYIVVVVVVISRESVQLVYTGM